MIRINASAWFLVFCPGCTADFAIPIDPRYVDGYTCPRCFTRFDGAPRHGQIGLIDPAAARIRLGEGLYVGLPAVMERGTYG